MKPTGYKIEQTAQPERFEDSDGCYRVPGEYLVTAPSGNTYKVEGTAYGYFERCHWSYQCVNGPTGYKQGFRSRYRCIDAIAALEKTYATAPNTFTGEAA